MLVYSRNCFFSIFSPGKAVTELGVSKFMKSPSSSNTEITPYVLIASKIKFLNCSRAGLKPLLESEEYERLHHTSKEKNTGIQDSGSGIKHKWPKTHVSQGPVQYSLTDASWVTKVKLNGQCNNHHTFVLRIFYKFPSQNEVPRLLKSMASNTCPNIKPFKWRVTSSGFSLVIRAAITWPLGQGTWAEFSKSMGASPQGDTPYIIRISLILNRGIPMAIWKVTEHMSFSTAPFC